MVGGGGGRGGGRSAVTGLTLQGAGTVAGAVTTQFFIKFMLFMLFRP